GGHNVQTTDLQLPHPRLHLRRFVLEPFAEIAPDFILPAPFHQTVGYLLEACPDHSEVRRTPLTLQPARRV
ncbi:MAG: 2-amino-4-hydroxy-6-hydroxymethyldihydropteridine diphosphokinase, partial [Bacteroidetes bacterium]|nr:2-amino-4-hydroxy-6-hydroxymethyldihydropteridine diphosphokinase [Bacteroidota bacterium]